MGAQIAIRGQQRDGDGQNWERNDDQDVSTQGRRVNTGIFIIGMPGTHLQNGGEEFTPVSRVPRPEICRLQIQ